jgi:hypothetical protein
MAAEQFPGCSRVLGLHLGGLRTDKISDDRAQIWREGMEVLVGHLASVGDGWEGEETPIPKRLNPI